MAITISEFKAKMQGWEVDDLGSKPGVLDSEDVIRMPCNNSGNPCTVRVYYEDAVEAYYRPANGNKQRLQNLKSQFELGITDAERWNGWQDTANAYRVVFNDLANDLASVDRDLSRLVAKYSSRAKSETGIWQDEVDQYRMYVKLVRNEFAQRL
jgi:hypothetical protein